jgi:hypothetical protein
MTSKLSVRLACAVTVTLITLMGSATPSIGAPNTAPPPGPPDVEFEFPAGVACADFDLRLEIWNNPDRKEPKVFKDENGNVVRILSTGKGNTLAFTNLLTNERLVLKANGANDHVAVNPDGLETHASTGHNVLILFPTDVPAGPSTTLYVGRIVFTVDANPNSPTFGLFTLQSTSGNSTDICAALS